MGTPRWPATSFAGRLARRERAVLLRLGEQMPFRNGQYLLRQGDRGCHVLLLVSGRTTVLIQGRARRVHRIGQRSTGDLVGELAFIDNRARSASVVASGAGLALRIGADAFDRFLAQNPSACRALTHMIADRLRAADLRWLELACDVLTRVAEALLDRADSRDRLDEITVYLTQEELARVVNASLTSVHRDLRRLAEWGVIGTGHKAIVIREPDRLAELAGEPPGIRHLT